ncbi:MAG: hypothetical protein ACRCXX_13990 [Cetobacterium sp.]|uniref:hypothetical protein n=1 Tax=Cetobacterium sp. TaxID=2071632 RepID=UPI003F2DDABA
MEKILNRILLQDAPRKTAYELIVLSSGVEVNIYTKKSAIIGIKTICGILHHKGLRLKSLSKKINKMLEEYDYGV